jgi:heptosyltransferase-2
MKFLIVRLSSMGDVVLTTPIVRALAQRFPEAEIHFLTREAYAPLLRHHPCIAAVHTWPPSPALQNTIWEGVIDLQKNLRTLALRWRLRYRHFTTFPKENLRKWQMVRQKRPIPLRHIVLRYGVALQPWNILPEELGPLEVHIPLSICERVRQEIQETGLQAPWLSIGLGGTYPTKKWPTPYYQALLRELGWGAILLGGVAEATDAATIAQSVDQPILNAAGRYSLLETAAAIAEAPLLLTHDTGTLHLGAAMGTPTVVLWGNTVPEFGMGPWQVPHWDIQAHHLRCRPCSKLGFSSCPRGHHDCMRALTPTYVLQVLREVAFRSPL